MMRGGFAAFNRGSSSSSSGAAPVAAAASATFMRFFKPCTVSGNQQNLESAAAPSGKEPSSREAFVQTPSLQKETKIKDIFNAKRKETDSNPAAESSDEAQKERARHK